MRRPPTLRQVGELMPIVKPPSRLNLIICESVRAIGRPKGDQRIAGPESDGSHQKGCREENVADTW